MNKIRNRYRNAPTELSPQQIVVLQMIAYGYETKEIARELDRSPRTVEIHRQNILLRLSASTAAHAVALALRSGVIK